MVAFGLEGAGGAHGWSGWAQLPSRCLVALLLCSCVPSPAGRTAGCFAANLLPRLERTCILFCPHGRELLLKMWPDNYFQPPQRVPGGCHQLCPPSSAGHGAAQPAHSHRERRLSRAHGLNPAVAGEGDFWKRRNCWQDWLVKVSRSAEVVPCPPWLE